MHARPRRSARRCCDGVKVSRPALLLVDRGAPRTCGGGGCALRLRPERKKRARVRLCAIGSALDQPPPPMCCPRAPGRDPRRSTRSVYVLWRRAQPLDVVRSPNSRNVTWYGRRRYSRTLTSGARAPITSNSHPVASASCVPSPLVSQVGSAEPRSRLALHLRHRAVNLVCRLVHPESALQVLQSVQVRGRAEWGLPQTSPSVSQPPHPPWVATASAYRSDSWTYPSAALSQVFGGNIKLLRPPSAAWPTSSMVQPLGCSGVPVCGSWEPALAVGAHQGAQAEVHRLQLPRGAPRGQNGWDRTSCARRVMSVHRPPRSAGFGMDFRSAVGRLVQIHRACWTENSITFDLYREPRCFCLWCSFHDA